MLQPNCLEQAFYVLLPSLELLSSAFHTSNSEKLRVLIRKVLGPYVWCPLVGDDWHLALEAACYQAFSSGPQ